MLGGDLRCESAGMLKRDTGGDSKTHRSSRIVHLERQGLLSEEVVRFYIAEIALAIDYLHSKKIVHR